MTSTSCEDAVAFLDGELEEARANAFRIHLPDCKSCQGHLERAFHLQAMLATAYAEAPPAAAVPPRTSRPPLRRAAPRWAMRTMAFLVAPAAAMLALLVLGPRPAAGDWAAPGPSREMEVRVTYGPADRYRPTDETMRGSEDAARQVPLMRVAAMESKGDAKGAATVFLLSHDLKQAEARLLALPPSAERDADLAALAWAAGNPQRALELSTAALKKNPRLPQAMWNRAVALRDLGFFQESAAAFREVAALGEPGWSDEAARKADTEDRRWKGRQEQAPAAPDAP